MSGYGTRGGWIVVGLINLFEFMPLISLVHSVALAAGMWFALRPAGVLSRATAFVIWLSFTVGAVYFLGDYAIAIANVGIVTVAIVARDYGVQLVRLQDRGMLTRVSPRLHAGQFSLSFVLWLPAAISYLLAVRWLCEPHSTSGAVATESVESAILAVVFIGVAYLCLKVRSPTRRVIIAMQFISPLMMMVEALARLSESEMLDAITRSDLGSAVVGVLIVTVFGVPLLTAILLMGRRRGYRLVWCPAPANLDNRASGEENTAQ
jgi:hypothetical protein